jgi:hypothetical protein
MAPNTREDLADAVYERTFVVAAPITRAWLRRIAVIAIPPPSLCDLCALCGKKFESGATLSIRPLPVRLTYE